MTDIDDGFEPIKPAPPEGTQPGEADRKAALETHLAAELEDLNDLYTEAAWEPTEFEDALEALVEDARRGNRWLGVPDVVAVDMRISPPEGEQGSDARDVQLGDLVAEALNQVSDAFKAAGWDRGEVIKMIELVLSQHPTE